MGWAANCSGALVGTTCQALCAANATGSAYVVRCDDTNTFTVINGSCKGVRLGSLLMQMADLQAPCLGAFNAQRHGMPLQPAAAGLQAVLLRTQNSSMLVC
jgi:hypothetical protein